MEMENVKTYIISKFCNSDNSISYYLDKKIKINLDSITVKTLFTFNGNFDNKIQKIERDFDEDDNDLTWYQSIIYSSHNFDECYNELELLANTNKYQL